MTSRTPVACEAHRDDLVALALGDADPKVEADLREHVDRCAECRGYLAAMRTTLAAVRSLPRPEPSPRVAEAILAAARAAAAPAVPVPPPEPSLLERIREFLAASLRRPMPVAAAAVAVVVVAVAATLTFVVTPDDGPVETAAPTVALHRDEAARPAVPVPPSGAEAREPSASPAVPPAPGETAREIEAPVSPERPADELRPDEADRSLESAPADSPEADNRVAGDEGRSAAGQPRRATAVTVLRVPAPEGERVQAALDEQQTRPDRFRVARGADGDRSDPGSVPARNFDDAPSGPEITTEQAALGDGRRESFWGPVGGSVAASRDAGGGSGLSAGGGSFRRPTEPSVPTVPSYAPPSPPGGAYAPPPPVGLPSVSPSTVYPAFAAAPAPPSAAGGSAAAAYADSAGVDDELAAESTGGVRSAGAPAAAPDAAQAESATGRAGEAEDREESGEAAPSAADVAFRQAESLERLGRWSETARAYELFVARYPADPRADEARWRAAQAYLRSGATVRAETILQRLLGTPQYDARARAALETSRRARIDALDETTVPADAVAAPAAAPAEATTTAAPAATGADAPDDGP